MELPTLSFHCYLCRAEIIPRPTNPESTSTFVAWEESCAESLRVILELDETFKPLVKSAVYCDTCLILVRDMNFLRISIERFQQRLNSSRQRVKSLLRSYYYSVVQEKEYSEDPLCDTKTNPADRFVKAVADALNFDYEPKDFCLVQLTSEETPSSQRKRPLRAKRKKTEETKPVDASNVDDLEDDIGGGVGDDPDFLPSHEYSEKKSKEDKQKLGKGKCKRKANTRLKALISRQRSLKQATSSSSDKTGRKIKCDWKGCMFRTTSQNFLNVHVRMKHEADPNPFHCEACGKQFSIRVRLTRHQKINCPGIEPKIKPKPKAHPLFDEETIQKRNIRCSYPECQYRTNSEFWMLVHRNKTHAEDSLTPFHCQISGCGQRFESQKHLNAHLRARLCQERILPDDGNDGDTPKEFNSVIVQNISQSTGSSPVANSGKRRKANLASAAPDPTRCEVCSKGFVTVEEVQSHVELHRQREAENIELAFSCVMPNCDKRFVCSLYLKYHVYNDHESKGVKCHICGVVVLNAYRLSFHMVNKHSTPNPVYKCPEPDCAFNGTCNADLRNHSVKHSGLKPHQCAICGKQYTWINSLNVHMRGHENFKPYKCSFTNCDKAFTTSYKLRTHEECHSNSANYVCAICPRSYKNIKHLQQHLRDVHQVQHNLQQYCLLRDVSAVLS